MDRFGRCRICELIDRGGPHYQESYRRLFHPEEFGGEAPSLLRKAANLAGAVASHVMSGMHKVDEATHAERLAKCGACPGGFWRPSDETCQHPTCGCHMRVKTWMAEQRCPIGEWEALPPK